MRSFRKERGDADANTATEGRLHRRPKILIPDLRQTKHEGFKGPERPGCQLPAEASQRDRGIRGFWVRKYRNL